MTEYDERSKRREKNRKIWVLYRPKIAMDVHDLEHRKLRKRGHGIVCLIVKYKN